MSLTVDFYKRKLCYVIRSFLSQRVRETNIATVTWQKEVHMLATRWQLGNSTGISNNQWLRLSWIDSSHEKAMMPISAILIYMLGSPRFKQQWLNYQTSHKLFTDHQLYDNSVRSMSVLEQVSHISCCREFSLACSTHKKDWGYPRDTNQTHYLVHLPSWQQYTTMDSWLLLLRCTTLWLCDVDP